MSMPTLESFAARIYAGIGPLAYDEVNQNYALAKYIAALGDMYQVVEDYSRDQVAGDGSFLPGWSQILDLTRAPDEVLPWLGQLVGVAVQQGATPAQQRIQISSVGGWFRGTPASIAAAAAVTLTGTQTVIVNERFNPFNPGVDSPGHFQVLTLGPETPDVNATQTAVTAQKPAGLIFHFDTVAGQTFQHLKDNHPLFSNVFADYATLEDVYNDTPQLPGPHFRQLFPSNILATSTVSGLVVRRGRVLPSIIHATSTVAGGIIKKSRITAGNVAATSTCSGIGISGASVTYDTLTNWSREAFTVVRDRPFTSIATLNSLLSTAVAGDYIHYTGTGVITATGEYTGFNIRPSGKVKIDLGLVSSGNYVKFTGVTSQGQFPAIWIHDAANLLIYGGEVTSALGAEGIMFYGGASATDTITWWDFVVHNTGSSGIGMLPTKPAGGASTISNCSLRGEVHDWGNHTAYDPHAEAGTGLHGVITADVGAGGNFNNNVIAIYAHDGPTGAGLECGQDNANGGTISGNTFYIKTLNLTKVATSQTAGNAINTWGGIAFASCVVGWIEGTNLQGRVVDNSGLYSPYTGKIDGGKLIFNHGRHTNTNLNPNLATTESWETASNPYGTRGNPTYNDCT